MFGRNKTNEMADLLADHLDRLLTAGDRLRDTRFIPRRISAEMTASEILDEHARLREFLEMVRALEMTLAARIDKARAWAKEVKARDPRFKLIASLFLTGTIALADTMEQLSDPRSQDFNSGDQALYFLKVRCMMGEHQHSLDGVRELRAGASYMIAGALNLKALNELCETFLEALDLHYSVLEPLVPAAIADEVLPAAGLGATVH